MKRTIQVLCTLMILSTSVYSDSFIRFNQAGYRPDRPKSLVIISTSDLAGQNWSIANGSLVLLQGVVPASIKGKGDHTSHSYNYIIDFSSLHVVGQYLFKTGQLEASIRVAQDPYSVLITDALRHLKTARSGSSEALNHRASHLGDSAAIIYHISGDPKDGKWDKASPLKTIDGAGGWYDGGDFLKFTLTIANTVYFLLDAWETNPKAFTKVLTPSDLPDVLDEAYHGLKYLMKVYPEPDLFIIQVGNNLDHKQLMRLPENDLLDGKRPALCSISPVHMGLTAAALAKGARVFKSIGRNNDATHFLDMALSVYERANRPDALKSAAFEHDEANDFYRDDLLDDNMALGATELYKTTGDKVWLQKALSYATGASNWISWTNYNWSVNAALASCDSVSKANAQVEMDYYVNNMDPVWGIPIDYCWSSLIGWCGVGAASGVWNRLYPDNRALDLHLKMVDYLFGRNNWGLSFLASTRLPNTITAIYNPVYRLNEIFPQGAVALGPVDRPSHKALQVYFGTPPGSTLDSFQTAKAVYYDWEKDFITTETSTISQSYAIWMLAIASDPDIQALPDTSNPPLPKTVYDIDSVWTLPIGKCNWIHYSDTVNSTSQWIDSASHTARLEPREGAKLAYAGICLKIPTQYQNLSGYDGITIYGTFDTAVNIRTDLAMKSITDYDFHGKNVLCKSPKPYSVLFKDVFQQGFGRIVDFHPDTIVLINFNYFSTIKPTTVKIDSIQFFRLKNHSTAIVKSFKASRNSFVNITRVGRIIQWKGKISTALNLQNILGRKLWSGVIKPGEKMTLPRIRGYQFLVTPDGMLVDKWIGL